jgi:protein-histidine pros-kinase
VKEFETTALDKNVQLSWNVAADVSAVLLGDSKGLRQVLSNLVENAVKFTAAGEVAVSVTVSPQDRSLVCFEVRDTGMGVPVDQQRIIFEPFSQVDNSLRRKFGGTGLGLAICAQIVEIMDGRIWVESDGRNGSTFHFTVHLEPVKEVPEKTAPERGGHPTRTERRRETRRPANDAVQMRILRPISPLPFTVLVLDMSNSGLRVLTSHSIEAEALVQFDFGNDVTLAEVRYCLPTGDRFHVGLEIIKPLSDCSNLH